jgi:hypothetical protein
VRVVEDLLLRAVAGERLRDGESVPLHIIVVTTSTTPEESLLFASFSLRALTACSHVRHFVGRRTSQAPLENFV